VSDLFGIAVAAITMEDVLPMVDAAIAERRPFQIGVVNAAKVVNMQRDPGLRDDVLASDIVLADGMSLVWASRLLGCPLPERVAGIDLMFRLLERAAAKGHRVFCLGATQQVLDAAVANFRAAYPGVTIAGTQHGYFNDEQMPAVVKEIRDARADVLFVALGAPRQERWINSFAKDAGATVTLGVGGLFDYYSGNIPRAPAWIRGLGLEWLFRLIQEPGRLWKRYLVGNWMFLGRIAADVAAMKSGKRDR
jgi:N-acetylglucosaminyldiphosphoundecaprenol N-acetyl-beta-D-mannosaminyltransferase